MDATLSTQTGLNTTIQDFALVIQETPDDGWTDGLLMSRSQMLVRYWESFEAAHVTILREDLSRTHPYFADKLYAQAERSYVAARGRHYDVRARLHPEPPLNDVRALDQPRGATRLPRILISTFSGRREDWESSAS